VTGNVAEFSEGNGGGIYNAGASATLAITNSIVRSNRAGDGAGGFTPFGHGGGIWSSGSATISTSTINDNTAGFGGGISNSGTLTIAGSTVDNNAAVGQQSSSYYGNGGGIENSGALTIINTILSGNSAKQFGGALYGDGIITNCTISGNTAVIYGGGISGSPAVTNCTISGNQGLSGGGGIHGSPTVTNSTISGNSAQFGNGGGIYGGGSISNSTISGNTANQGGGGIVAVTTVEITNTILKAGASDANIVNNGGTVTTHGYNISNDNGAGFLTGAGDQINTDPMLGPLQNNGGPTFTHDLLAGSPALDAGNPSFTPPPSTDQRGYARIFNGRIDIGALEVQPTPPPITISGTISYCSNPVPGPVPNVTLTLTGTSSGSTLSDGSGNYTFSSLPSGGNYTITPTKATRTPGSPNINTVDVIAVQRHFLNLGIPLAGCRLIAADVNSDTSVNTVDVIAIQRFYLGQSTGIANTGQYQFTPVSRTYTAITGNQTAQNYDTLIFGDVASPFAAP
jgi:parallel beta-helix repeat protein/predicted outer membrane repeat protein